jgi:hypothetical protein
MSEDEFRVTAICRILLFFVGKRSQRQKEQRLH